MTGAWEIAPGEEVGLDFSGLTLDSGELVNASAQIGRGRTRARAQVSALMGDPAGRYLDFTIEEDADLLLPAIQKYSESTPVRLRNDGTETVFLAFGFKFSAEMTYEEVVFRAAIHPVGQATSMNHLVYEVESSGPAFQSSVVMEDRVAGLEFRPTPVTRSHRLVPGGSADGGMQVELAIDELSLEGAPLKSFYQGLRIQGSPTLKRGSWFDLGEMVMRPEGPFETTQSLPNGPKLFLRVTGVESEDLD